MASVAPPLHVGQVLGQDHPQPPLVVRGTSCILASSERLDLAGLLTLALRRTAQRVEMHSQSSHGVPHSGCGSWPSATTTRRHTARAAPPSRSTRLSLILEVDAAMGPVGEHRENDE